MRLLERHHQHEEPDEVRADTVGEGRDVHIGWEFLPVLPFERRGVHVGRRAHPFLGEGAPGQVLLFNIIFAFSGAKSKNEQRRAFMHRAF